MTTANNYLVNLWFFSVYSMPDYMPINIIKNGMSVCWVCSYNDLKNASPHTAKHMFY